MKRHRSYLSILTIVFIVLSVSAVSRAQFQDSLLDQMKQGGSTLGNVNDVKVFNQGEKAEEALTEAGRKISDTASTLEGQLTQSAGDLLDKAKEGLENVVQLQTGVEVNPEAEFEQFDQPRRDPFAVTGFMLEKFNNKGRAGENSFTSVTNVKLPSLSLKGLVRKQGLDVVALLEIENQGVFVVREGDTVGFRQGENDRVLKVRKIERLSVIVEAGNLGKLIVVR